MGVRRLDSFTNGVAILPRRLASSLRAGTLILAVTVVMVGSAFAVVPAGDVEIASVNNAGRSGNLASGGVASSFSGDVVGFFSDATNLVPFDTNQVRDVFVRNRVTDTTQRISVNSSGEQANRASQAAGGDPAVNGDGTLVSFYSDATNLVANDNNGFRDVFLRNRTAGTTELISVGFSGELANGPSIYPSISADGRFVAFQSLASNLVPGDDNNVSDIFVRDRQTGTTERLCGGIHGNRGSLSAAISGDGKFVAFASASTNLVPADTNGRIDIFLCQRSTGTLQLVSVSSDGTPGDGDSILPSIDSNGEVIAFKSLATNLVPDDRNNVVDVFARDRAAGTTERISDNFRGGDPNDFSFPPSISGDGRFVAFGSFATNLTLGDSNNTSNVFVRDRQIQRTFLVDVNAAGEIADNGTPDAPPGMSGDGLRIAFISAASNLAGDNKNDVPDAFSALNPFFCQECCPFDMCPPGKVCEDGICVMPTPTRTPTRTGTPTPTPTRTPTVTPTPTFIACMTDADCPPANAMCTTGFHCRAGFCKCERPCGNSSMCYAREACVGNLCECGVDCNLDGVVLGFEITRSVLILGGVKPITFCPAADVNGDGMVTAPEVTAGVINQASGCAQEGLPLVFGGARDGMITFTVGSASGSPGKPTTVSIDMQGSGGQVASAQVDLLYDPAILDVGDPGTNCRIGPRLDAQFFSATAPSDPPAPAGLKRLRLFVGDIEAPVSTFGDGTIASCSFSAKPGTAGVDAVLGLDHFIVSDDLANVFSSQAVSGALSITSPVSKPVCAGDCNGDGQVTTNEITRTMLIMLGAASVSECAAADLNGDGSIFVSEMTRALTSFRTGCVR